MHALEKTSTDRKEKYYSCITTETCNVAEDKKKKIKIQKVVLTNFEEPF